MLKFLPSHVRYLENEAGSFGIIVALSLVPLIGIGGMAVDYARALQVKTSMRDKADNIALSIASKGPDNESQALNSGMIMLAKWDERIAPVSYTSEWKNGSDVHVVATASVPVTLARVLPGIDKTIDVSVESVARFKGFMNKYETPRFAEMSRYAWDYNRLSVYCFNPAKPGSEGRGPIVDLVDNVGTNYNSEMPLCETYEILSLRLLRIERGKKDNNWQQKERNRQYNLFFTDTTIVDGNYKFNLYGYNILETVLCDNAAECVPDVPGSRVPAGDQNGRGQTRSDAKGLCEPGKSLFYGFEDNPPRWGGSDEDYDDIRVTIDCPVPVQGPGGNVFLLR